MISVRLFKQHLLYLLCAQQLETWCTAESAIDIIFYSL